jgi:hypothetical protein
MSRASLVHMSRPFTLKLDMEGVLQRVQSHMWVMAVLAVSASHDYVVPIAGPTNGLSILQSPDRRQILHSTTYMLHLVLSSSP